MNRDDMRALADALTAHHRQPTPRPAPTERPSAPIIDGQAKTPDTDMPPDEADARNTVDSLFGTSHRTPQPGNYT